MKRKSTGRRDCDSEAAGASLYSTVHSAGPLFGPKEAKRRFTRAEMDAWLQSRGVMLVGHLMTAPKAAHGASGGRGDGLRVVNLRAPCGRRR